MRCAPRKDDFATRRKHLQKMSDQELHAHFWKLVEDIVAPLIEEARTHTTPSIERSVLMRMGFSSVETKVLVQRVLERGLLGRGAGRLLLGLARTKGVSVREAGTALIEGKYGEELGA